MALHVKGSIDSKSIKSSPEKKSSVESLWVEILYLTEKNIVLGLYYQPTG